MKVLCFILRFLYVQVTTPILMTTSGTTADTITNALILFLVPIITRADGVSSTQLVLMTPTETTMATRTSGTKLMAISTRDTTTYEETTPSKATIKATTGTTTDDGMNKTTSVPLNTEYFLKR